mmetsp:Transcript_45175/g.88369  ORF Transcript_45175/g.88369 Transcript_45175/m.88369 type:complete len:423 (-) Transcript_45175:132-1400(-)
MGKTEKYTLHKTGDGPKVCAFYATEKGCKTGASCKFVHGEIPAAAAPTPVFNSHFDTSSEDDSAAENDTCTKPLVMTPAKKKKAAPKEKVSAKSPAKAKSSAKTKSSAKAVTDDDDDDIFVAPSSKKTKKRSSISAAAAPSTPSTKKARTVPAAATNSSPPAPVAAAGASPAGGGAALTVRLKEMEDQVGLDGSGAILGRVVSLEECVFGGGYALPSRMLLARVAALETNLLGEVQATAADAHMFTLTDVGSSAMFTPMDVGSSIMKKKEYEDATEQISVQISNKQEKNLFDKSKHAVKLHKTSPKNSDQTTVPSFRSLATSRRSKDEDRTRCLLVHRIPKRCTEEHLSKIFSAHTGDVPAEIPQIEFGNGNTGKVMVRFESKEQAASVFEGIEGKIQNDAAGAPQKRVYLKNGGYINIRGI